MNMQLMDAIYERKSIRKFKKEKINSQELQQIIKAGTLAPSAKNRQPWHFYVIQDNDLDILLKSISDGIENLSKKYANKGIVRPDIDGARATLNSMQQASAIILIACQKKYQKSFADGVDWYLHALDIETTDILSIGAAIEHMLLKATEMGYGTLWVCDIFYAYPQIIKFLQTKDAIVSAVCIGLPDEFPSNRPRLSVEDVTTFYHSKE